MKRSDTRESFELKAMLNAIGNDLASSLPSRVLESYRELIDIGELKVALENLCTNLDDLEVKLSAENVEAIWFACERLGLGTHYSERLMDQG
jgi:hypothetical protein